MPDDPEFYPDFPCDRAPLRASAPAPSDGCGCRICAWARRRLDIDGHQGPIRPNTAEWAALLGEASR